MTSPRPSRFSKRKTNANGTNAPATARAGSIPPSKVRGPLVWIDERPLRRAALKEHDNAKRVFNDLKDDINRFHQHDKPQFERWLRDHFADEVQAVTTARAAVAELRELIFEVETRTYLRNQSFAAAYRDVMERRQKAGDNAANPDLQDIEEQLKQRQREAEERETAAQEAEVDNPVAARSAHCPTANLPAERAQRLKAAYRSMARRFHPDCNNQITPEMMELWHEAQRAYLAGDVELLESIDAASEQTEAEVGAQSPLSLIRTRTQQLLQNHRALVRKLDELHKDRAWGFSKLRSFKKIKQELAQSLPNELKELKDEAKKLQEKIRRWREDAERYYPGFKEAMNPQAPSPARAGADTNAATNGKTGRSRSFNRAWNRGARV